MIPQLQRSDADRFFNGIASGCELSHEQGRQLVDRGFAVAPRLFSNGTLAKLTAAYDNVMMQGSGQDFKVASATTRMFDLVNRGPEFDEIYIHPLLLEACAHLIEEPFKLSSLLARTLRAKTPVQELHADLPRGSGDAPMVGFILMIDGFEENNGSTRFVPGSQAWPHLPSDCMSDLRSDCQSQVLACGEPGSMIIFNGSIWHGHTANVTLQPRRSIQGYFVRRSAHSGLNFADRMLPETLLRISPLAKYLLAIE
jgi:hypothetical protein